MEDELRCPLCKQLYVNPVLLPCYHALCITCALDSQVQIANNNNNNNNTNNNNSNSNTNNNSTTTTTIAQIHQPPQPPSTPNHQPAQSSQTQTQQQQTNQATQSVSPPNNNASSGQSTSSTSESISSDQDTADKVSILSEADSGVICTSRPNSYAGTPNLALLFPPSGGAVYSLTCPACRKIVFFDDGGARNLPPYRTMESIIDRFCEREALRCQMCEIEPKIAAVVCEQCEIRYCDSCRELCHPSRVPALAKHNLVAPRGGQLALRESVCIEHNTEALSMFCLTCKLALCQQCLSDNRHQSHDIQSIATICKSQKVN